MKWEEGEGVKWEGGEMGGGWGETITHRNRYCIQEFRKLLIK